LGAIVPGQLIDPLQLIDIGRPLSIDAYNETKGDVGIVGRVVAAIVVAAIVVAAIVVAANVVVSGGGMGGRKPIPGQKLPVGVVVVLSRGGGDWVIVPHDAPPIEKCVSHQGNIQSHGDHHDPDKPTRGGGGVGGCHHDTSNP
jgi:hypothetical protein